MFSLVFKKQNGKKTLQNQNLQSPLLPRFPLSACPFLPFRTIVNISTSSILTLQSFTTRLPFSLKHFLPRSWVTSLLLNAVALLLVLTLLEFWAQSDTGCGLLLNSLSFQLLWPLPHNVLSASPVQSPPQAPRLPIWWSSEACFTTPLISHSLPGGSCVREQKSTLIRLSGKGIYWQDIRKLPQQKGMRNNQASSDGTRDLPRCREVPGSLRGALSSECASSTHCWPYVFLCMRFKFLGKKLWSPPWQGQLLPAATQRCKNSATSKPSLRAFPGPFSIMKSNWIWFTAPTPCVWLRGY